MQRKLLQIMKHLLAAALLTVFGVSKAVRLRTTGAKDLEAMALVHKSCWGQTSPPLPGRWCSEAG